MDVPPARQELPPTLLQEASLSKLASKSVMLVLPPQLRDQDVRSAQPTHSRLSLAVMLVTSVQLDSAPTELPDRLLLLLVSRSVMLETPLLLKDQAVMNAQPIPSSLRLDVEYVHHVRRAHLLKELSHKPRKPTV